MTAKGPDRLQLTLILTLEEIAQLTQEAMEQERTLAAEVRYIVKRYLRNGAAS